VGIHRNACDAAGFDRSGSALKGVSPCPEFPEIAEAQTLQPRQNADINLGEKNNEKTQPATRTQMIEVLRALQEEDMTNAEFEKFRSAAGAGETWHPNLANTIKHYEERIKGHELGPKSAKMPARLESSWRGAKRNRGAEN